MTTEQRLKEIEERVSRATEGPWKFFYGECDDEDAYGDTIQSMEQRNSSDVGPALHLVVNGGEDWPVMMTSDTGRFIAHSREDIPYLLALVRQTLATNADLVEKLRKLQGDLETERMRLAACGVAAMCNTEESKERHRISKDSPYYSASYSDVCNAVDREMNMRSERDEAVRLLRIFNNKFAPSSVKWRLDEFLSRMEKPNPDCVCAETSSRNCPVHQNGGGDE